jgi:putative SOS response-associated peptidase YedK
MTDVATTVDRPKRNNGAAHGPAGRILSRPSRCGRVSGEPVECATFFNHHQPSRDPRALPRGQSLRNLQPTPGVFPDYPAPVIRNTEAGTEMTLMRWDMPPPPRTGGPPVTNIRNTSSPHWRGWLKPENRCLVPANSFAEYAPEPNPQTGKKDVVWFALNEDRPLFAFAGIWTTFDGEQAPSRSPGLHQVCGFLTTETNAVGSRSIRRPCRSS